ncbi:MAG: hypothetical protein VXZ16_02960 [Bacteroidota bacterium]|nr:hypothetical protein [Bacteroidota bacterium]
MDTPDQTYQTLRTLWWRHGGLGCLLIGAGLSVTLDASAQRIVGEAWWLWGLEGTLGLVIFMSGLGFFGSSVRYLVLRDLTNKAQE